jgi:hypothetical protein
MMRDAAPVWPIMWILAAVVMTVPSIANAQNTYPTTSNSAPSSSTSNYWTSEKMQKAVPPQIGLPGGPTGQYTAPQPEGTPGVAGGAAPSGGNSKREGSPRQ